MPTLREAWTHFLRLLRLTRPYWRLIARSILLALIVGMLSLIPPYISKLLIDEVHPTKDLTFMQVLVAGLLTIMLTTAAMGALREYFGQVISTRLHSAASMMFLNHLLHLPVHFYDEHRVGEVTSRFQDLRSSLSAVTSAFETVFLRGTYIILVPPLLFLLNWKLALLSLITVPATTAVATVSGQWLRRRWKETAEVSADLRAYQVEVLTHIRTLKGMGLEHRVFGSARDLTERALNLRLRAGGLGAMINLVNGSVRNAGTAVYTWFGWTLILSGEITLGTFIAFSAYRGYLTGPINKFASFFISFQRTAVSIARTFEYLDEPPEQNPTETYRTAQPELSPIRGSIAVHDVSFGYDPQRPVLRQVNLAIPQGSTTAIVGASGAGKSSLLHLLGRMREPDSGYILLDGQPAASIPLRHLRRQCSVVWQDPALFRGTLWDNLTIGNEEASPALVEEAIRVCRLSDLVADLPAGYNTPVAEWGATLSAGQRQRVAIARALIRQTPLLLLDEATSNVDPHTESAILTNLFARIPRPTIVFVTHRIGTAPLADQVIVLDDGRVVGSGVHRDLLSNCESYRTMVYDGLHRTPETRLVTRSNQP